MPMTETGLRKLASAYAAGKLSFLEYRKLRTQFICDLVGEDDNHGALRSLFAKIKPNSKADSTWLNSKEKPSNPVVLITIIIVAALGISLLFI